MKKVKLIMLLLICAAPSAGVFAEHPPQKAYKPTIALLPYLHKGLSDEEADSVTKTFEEALRATGKFELLAREEMQRLLAEARFSNLEACTYSYCLADAGKILGVSQVMQGSITRRGQDYELRLQLVDVQDAKILLYRRTEFSGEFDRFLSEVIPKEAHAASEQTLEATARWYIVAGAILVTVGAIYSIYRAFKSSAASEGSGGGPPSTTQ